MRWIRAGVLALSLSFGLGCMGLVNGMSGLDLEMGMEENAVHPADFPVGPPTTGKKTMSMGITTDGDNLNLPNDIKLDVPAGTLYKMQLIVYEEIDPTADLAAAVEILTKDGYTVLPSNETSVVVYEKQGEMFVVAADTDNRTLSYIRLKPKAEAAIVPAQ